MQISNNDNRTAFGARLVFKDKGNCFSLRQKFQLKSLAKRIGDSSDCFYVGTRRYDNVSIFGDEPHFYKKDMQILSSVGGVNREYRVLHNSIQQKVENDTMTDFYDLSKSKRWKKFNTNMFEYLKTFLTTFKEPSATPEFVMSLKSIRKRFKKEVSEFTSLKRTYYKETTRDKIAKLFPRDTNKTVKKEKSNSDWSDFQLFPGLDEQQPSYLLQP